MFSMGYTILWIPVSKGMTTFARASCDKILGNGENFMQPEDKQTVEEGQKNKIIEKAPLKESLQEINFPQILTSLNKEQKTGIIIFEGNNIKKRIYLNSGNPIFASSSDNNERLGSMLLRGGKISLAQYDKSVELLTWTGKRIGTILVELGYLTPRGLFLELKNQVREIILSFFELENGIFRFKETIPSAEIITFKAPIAIEELIREGPHRIEENKRKNAAIFIHKINELCENIDRLNYYDLLEVQRDASSHHIKKAYLQMIKHYHPDKYHSVSDNALKEKLAIVSPFLNKAYETLTDEARRAEYDKTLLRMARGKTTDNDLIKADKPFRKGLEEFKNGNFRGAAELFSWTVQLKPEKATYWGHLSLALSKIPRRKKEAEEAMLKAIEIDPYNVNYYIHLGIFYINLGMRQRAIRQFETILTLDPTHTKAHRELEKLKIKKKRV